MEVLNRGAAGVRLSVALTAAATLFGAGALAQPSPRPVEDYRVKAALIYSLAKFVEWPAAAFADGASRFTVCVIGSDPFGPALESATSGHTISGRQIAIRRLMAYEPGCHILFISDSEVRRVPIILDQLRGQSVLSIGDDRSFLDRGGMVAFYKSGEHIRFDVRAEAVDQARLKVSARVMAVVNRAGGATP
jgi:hypothetical protein